MGFRSYCDAIVDRYEPREYFTDWWRSGTEDYTVRIAAQGELVDWPGPFVESHVIYALEWHPERRCWVALMPHYVKLSHLTPDHELIRIARVMLARVCDPVAAALADAHPGSVPELEL